MKFRKSFHVFLLNDNLNVSVEEVKHYLTGLSSKGYPDSETNYIFAQNDQCESTYMVLYSTLTLDEVHEMDNANKCSVNSTVH